MKRIPLDKAVKLKATREDGGTVTKASALVNARKKALAEPAPTMKAPTSWPPAAPPQVNVSVQPDPRLASAVEAIAAMVRTEQKEEPEEHANKWVFTVERDHNQLIKTVTAVRGK